MSPDVIAAVQSERAKAAAIVNACDVFLQAWPQAPMVEGDRAKVERRAKVAKVVATKVKPAAVAMVRTGRAAAVEALEGGESKQSRYAAVIVKVLSHFSMAPSYSADRAILNREIAQACGVKPEALIAQDVSNALQKLKAAGTIERTGTVWALVEKPE